jgi:hypothetical protein
MSDRDEKTLLRFREWLEPDDLGVNSSLSGAVKVETWVDKSGDRGFNVSASLSLTDCHRSIDWDFSAYDDFDALNDALLKLRRVEELTARFRAALEKAKRQVESHQRRPSR